MKRNRPDRTRHTRGALGNRNVPRGGIEMVHNGDEDAHADPIRVGGIRTTGRGKRRDA